MLQLNKIWDSVILVILGLTDLIFTIIGFLKEINDTPEVTTVNAIINCSTPFFLGVVLLYLGYERHKHRQKIETPIMELMNRFGRLQIVDGSVTELLIDKISKAKRVVRATAIYDNEREGADEHRYDEYYAKLIQLLSAKSNFEYRCAYNAQKYHMQYRFEKFKEYGSVKKVYKKMLYYPINSQMPINMIIVDRDAVVIGFRTKQADEKTSLSIVIDCNDSTNMQSAKEFNEFIDNVISWYDHVLLHKSVPKDGEELRQELLK